ncbi:metallopeptidase MepB [Hysterangium stoloniferum]|nr:metallopeptidase MepB [Hysterangium stoloniferum]
MSEFTLKPPQEPPSWSHTPEQILSLAKETIESMHALRTRVAELPRDARSFSAVFIPLAEAEARLETIKDPLTFYQHVSPSKELRDASTAAEGLFRDAAVEESMRVDVFNAIQGTADSIQSIEKENNPEAERLVQKMLRDGKRAGLALPQDLKKELSRICLEFLKNFSGENGTIEFSLEELEGIPKDVLSGYKILSGENGATDLYSVSFKAPDIIPVFKFASTPETRRRALAAYDDRLSINEPLFTRAMDLRRRLATLLGYKTWADFVTEDKMVKSADNAFKFLDDVLQRLMPVGIKDKKALLALKKEEHKERGYHYDEQLYAWDYQYYIRKFTEKTLSLDDSLIREYFPVAVVVRSILNIYQDLLGVKFQEMQGETWHPDVQLFSVWDNDAKDKKDFLGYCYLDILPRGSKFPHAAVWHLIPGYEISPNGDRQYPVCAIVANVAKDTPDRPALMRHSEVVTFFHEMGHVFHGLLSRTRFSRFHGTAVANDFVEAPSKMLENWCWEPRVLKKMSSHYKTKEPLSDDLIDKLTQGRNTNVGLFYLRQGFFGMFDLRAHTSQAEENYMALWNNLRQEISLLQNDEKFVCGQGAFGHLFGGYEAGYYGYMYALVFATDMYRTVFKENPLDPKLGKLYRDKILLPGGSRDEAESLMDFLGREPTSDAFLEDLLGMKPFTTS